MTTREISVAMEEMDREMDRHVPPLYFVRLNLNERIQHLIFVTCFLMLALTGLMVWLPERMFHFLGDAKETVFLVRGILHRIFAALMILVCIYHVTYLIFNAAGRRWLLDMRPRVRDVGEFFNNMLYLVGLKDQPPEFDRFSYKHKMEYGALIAGTSLMTISGIILWSEYFWDKFIVDIAALIHGMEAVLACLAVMIWHLYEVHLRPHKFPVDHLWLTGVIDEAEMKAEYPLHYKKIMRDPALQKIYLRRGAGPKGEPAGGSDA